MWVNWNLLVFPIIKSLLWPGEQTQNPHGACTLIGGLIRRVSSCFLETLKSAAPAVELRAQEDRVTGVTSSSRGLARVGPLWAVPHLCWSLHHRGWGTAHLTAHQGFAWLFLSPGNSLTPGSAARGMETLRQLQRDLLSSLPGSVWFSVEAGRAPFGGSYTIRLRDVLGHDKGLHFQSGTLGCLCWNPITFHRWPISRLAWSAVKLLPAAQRECLHCLCEGEQTWS